MSALALERRFFIVSCHNRVNTPRFHTEVFVKEQLITRSPQLILFEIVLTSAMNFSLRNQHV